MFLATWTPPSVLAIIGPITIHWYGVCMAIGALAAYMLLRIAARRAGVTYQWVTDVFILIIIGGFIGARLYHVANEWDFYVAHPGSIFAVWNGGLAIHGAMIAGLGIAWVMSRTHRINTWLTIDLLALSLPLGQAIGRWGNYFNQELYGLPTNMPWKLRIAPAYRLLGFEDVAYYHPTFLYESIGCLVILGILWVIWRQHQTTKTTWLSTPGNIALIYFVLYGLLRIGVESLRIDRVPVVFGERLPLITSAVIIILSFVLLIIRSVRAHAHRH